jgi:hypothetical protein
LRIVKTSLGNSDITELITLADDWLDIKIGTASLTANILKLCSMLKTAILIKSGDPTAYSTGFVRVQYGSTIENYEKVIDDILSVQLSSRKQIKTSEYQKIDEDSRYQN